MKRTATKLTALTIFRRSVFNISDLILTGYCTDLCPALGLRIQRYKVPSVSHSRTPMPERIEWGKSATAFFCIGTTINTHMHVTLGSE